MKWSRHVQLIAAALWGVLLAGADAPAPAAPAGPSLRVREIFVPYGEFRALTEGSPDGVVMSLQEYRALVVRAAANVKDPIAPVLPPLDAAVADVRYEGAILGNAVRVRGACTVVVAAEGWVRCDFGAGVPNLGAIVVDDAPGWLVVEGEVPVPGVQGKNVPHAFLFLRGKGAHRVDFVFTLPLREEEDRSILEGTLIPAPSAKLELTVPGTVEASALPANLTSTPKGETTQLELALGNATSFRLQWRRTKALGERETLLAAWHGIGYVPRGESPVFTWNATVQIARRKTDKLVLTEPPGARVLTLTSKFVHSWTRTPAGLELLLNEPMLGMVSFEAAGVVENPGERYTFGVPALTGAFADAGYLALYAPAGAELEVQSAEAAREVAPGDLGVPPVCVTGERVVAGTSVAAVYAFTSRDARVTALVKRTAVEFETHATLLALVSEASARLEGVLRVTVRDGRVYGLRFDVPAPWKLTFLGERIAQNAPPYEVAYTVREDKDVAHVDVRLGRAVARGTSLDLQVRLEHATFAENAAWPRRDLALALPVCAGAARNRCDLGLAIPTSMDAVMAALPEWRTLETAEIEARGLGETAKGQNLELIAALTSRAAAPALTFTLVRRAVRGEYQAVTHLLALERALRVRTDIRLTAVDRPIERMEIRLPAIAGPSTVILGEGIKEVETVTGGRSIRFGTPWLGTRQFRVEFEAPLSPDAEFTAPIVTVEAPKDDGFFGSERFLVLQSQGPVEIGTPKGASLSPADVDDVPEFAEAWRVGRVLSAYRFKARGEAGLLRTAVHGRAPVLQRLVRQMLLTTIIGREGVTRTQAELTLAYSRDQDFKVELPTDARILSATVDGEPVRTLITKLAGTQGKNIVAIPLPPQSYATVVLTYERLTGDGAALGRRGTWREEAPRFPDMPVGETVWSFNYPREYLFFLKRDGGFRAADPRDETASGSFAESFFGRVFTGRRPILTSFRTESGAGGEVQAVPLSPEELRGALQAGGADAHGRLAAKGERAAAARSTMPRCRVLPEGLHLEAFKVGPGTALTLVYGERAWWHFATRSMCLIGLIAGLVLCARRRFAVFAGTICALVLAGTCLPFVFGLRSPLVVVPLCEGLVLALCAGSVLVVLKRVVQAIRRSRHAVRGAATPAGAAIVLAALLAGNAAAAEAVSDTFVPAQGAIIGYDPGTVPGVPTGHEKAYVPYALFRELWKLANPEKAQDVPSPIDLVLGGAEYTLELEGTLARIRGKITVNVLVEKWVAFPLPFSQAQLGSICIDGVATGVGQTPDVAKGGVVPFVQIKGKGVHTIEIECTTAVRSEAGGNSILVGLVAGSAASLRAELPPGAKVAARGARGGQEAAALPVAVESSTERTRAVVDLGGGDRIELAWSFPKIEGQKGSQVASVSYTRLALEHGSFALERRERVRVTGKPIDVLAYAIEGAWRVTEVVGADLAEWSVLRDEGGAERLQIFFTRPVAGVALLIRGRALLDGKAALTTLTLKDAVAQETYIGLRHGNLARFRADVLSGMQRSARDVIAQLFGVSAEELPDRLYHAYGSGAGESLAVEPAPVEVTVATTAAAVVGPDRCDVWVRSVYEVTGPGPLRHEVAIPRGWSVRNVASNALRDWRVTPQGEGSRLIVTFNERAVTGTEVLWSAEQAWDSLPGVVTLAEPATLGITRESMRVLFGAAEELELTVREAGRMVSASLDAAPPWVPLPAAVSFRFALRSPRSERPETAATLSVAVARRESRLSALVLSFARVSEEWLEVNARVLYRIRNAGRDRFRLELPEGAALVSVATRNQRSREVAGNGVEIVLQSPVTGEHAVDIAYRVPRGQGELRVAPIKVLDGATRLADVDQYVGVLQTGAAFVEDKAATGLARVEAERIPYLPEGVSAGNLKPTYRATALDWSLALAEVTVDVTEDTAAIIVLAELTTVVGEDGTARTRVVYNVQNRVLQFLLLELPEGVDLWGVTLNGKAVAVGEAPGKGKARVVRVPVEHVGAGSLDLEVTVQYEERAFALPTLRGTASLRAPRVLDTNVLETIWNVQFPDGYRVSMAGGTMREVVGSAHYARKVGNLLDQYERISRAASSADSRRLREQAQRDLSRLEQVLGDNITELTASNRSTWERTNVVRLGEADVNAQWESNDDLIMKSQEVQQSLKQVKEEQAKAPKVVTKREQAFIDNTNFLKQEWLYNGVLVQAPEGAPRGAGGGEALPSVRGLTLAPQRVEVEVAAPAAVDGSKGLAPLPEALLGATAPGVEVAPAAKGSLAYTFLVQGGEADLTIAFTRQDAVPRLAALLVLLLGICLTVWWARRQR